VLRSGRWRSCATTTSPPPTATARRASARRTTARVAWTGAWRSPGRPRSLAIRQRRARLARHRPVRRRGPRRPCLPAALYNRTRRSPSRPPRKRARTFAALRGPRARGAWADQLRKEQLAK
jgi:hypothetical protein